MINDPIIEEVREIRDQLASEFNYDIHAIFESLHATQRRFGHRARNKWT